MRRLKKWVAHSCLTDEGLRDAQWQCETKWSTVSTQQPELQPIMAMHLTAPNYFVYEMKKMFLPSKK